MSKLLWISIILWTVYGYVASSGNCNPACQTGLDCCGTVCYDNTKQMCCDDTVQNRIGTLSECCGTQGFDFSKQICCNGTISDKNGITWCCGNAAYSPKTNQCCNNVVSPMGTCSNTKASLVVKSTNDQCTPTCQTGYECCNGVCFDNTKQICCMGTIQDRVGMLPQCCGTQEFDFSKQICCHGTIFDKNGFTWCCGNTTYSPTTNQCCNNVVSPLGTCSNTKAQVLKSTNIQCTPSCQSGYECCNGVCFDNSKQMCCDGTIQNRVGTLSQCCGTQGFDFSKQVCCNGTISDRNGITWCCGNAAYSPKTNQCCNNVVSPLGTCSNFKAQNEKFTTGQCTPVCQAGYECCDGVCFDNTKQMCCDGTLQDRVGTLPECCGTQGIDFSKQICCNGTISDKNGLTWCCGNAAYSPKTNQCCNNIVSPLGTCSKINAYRSLARVSSTQCNPTCQAGYDCCKSTCFDTQKQLCCDGTIIKDKVGTNPQCCDANVIDYSKQLCCDGTPQNRLDTITFCCGKSVYSPLSNSCCNQVIVPKGTCT